MDSISKSDIDKSFGKVFREYRDKHSLTQEQLSEKIGISVKFISRVENGSSGVKPSTLINYINELGITPNILYRDLIDNESVKSQIEISEKISTLSDEKIAFLNAIIDLIKTLDS